MTTYRTVFGSLDKHEKGTIEIINDDAKHYVYSNVFEVVGKAKPYEKTAVAKNLEYVIEAIRAEGRSRWMSCAHDEFVVVLDGEVEVELVKLANAPASGPRHGREAGNGAAGRRARRQAHGDDPPQARAPGLAAGRFRVSIQRRAALGDDPADAEG